MKQSASNSFFYLGYHFIPEKTLTGPDTSFYQISKHLVIDGDSGLFSYPWKKKNYSYQSFYAASPVKDCDIFRCVETGRLYIPAVNELFVYSEQ